MVAPIRPYQLEALREKVLRETEQYLNCMLGSPMDRHTTRPQTSQNNATQQASSHNHS